MPIPFRAVHDVDTLPPAGFLRLLRPGEGTLVGAIFQVTPRGEPVEFTLCHVTSPGPAFWRDGDLASQATRVLLEGLLRAAPQVPGVLLVLPEEFHPDLFQAEVQPSVPVGAVVPAPDSGWQCDWVSERPAIASPALRVVAELASRGILREPFERALKGLLASVAEGTPPA